MPNSRQTDLWKTLAGKAGELEIAPNKEAKLMPLALVDANPWQPRQHFDETRLDELVEDIRLRGILQPLVVRASTAGRYQVVAGERRYRAARQLALETVPVIVKEGLSEDEARAIALVENLQREDLDIEDEARFLKALSDQGYSLREIAAAIHKSHNYVNRRLKLLEDPSALLAYRAGRFNLNRLLEPLPDGPLDRTPGELEDDAVPRGNRITGAMDPVPPGNNAPDGEVRFIRSTSAYKPFQKLQLHVRQLQPAALPEPERAGLRQTVNDLIEELLALRAQLDEDTTDVGS